MMGEQKDWEGDSGELVGGEVWTGTNKGNEKRREVERVVESNGWKVGSAGRACPCPLNKERQMRCLFVDFFIKKECLRPSVRSLWVNILWRLPVGSSGSTNSLWECTRNELPQSGKKDVRSKLWWDKKTGSFHPVSGCACWFLNVADSPWWMELFSVFLPVGILLNYYDTSMVSCISPQPFFPCNSILIEGNFFANECNYLSELHVHVCCGSIMLDLDLCVCVCVCRAEIKLELSVQNCLLLPPP